MKLKHIFKRLAVHLARFTAFTAAACAILFGLPALATHHPFILLTVSLSVLILAVYAIHKPAANPKAAKHRTATHRKAA
jgi:hypothetical protein